MKPIIVILIFIIRFCQNQHSYQELIIIIITKLTLSEQFGRYHNRNRSETNSEADNISYDTDNADIAHPMNALVTLKV